jgi:DNA-binding PadR family transcriptional regulator
LLSQPLKRISQPRGLLRLYVLYRLSKKPMSGYDLMSDLDELTGGAWHPGSGSIYPALENLRRRGLVEASSKGKRSKQVYSITRKGVEALDEHKKMINQFARKWNNIRIALTELISAENLSAILLEATKFNRAAWDRICDSDELSKGQLELALKEYRLLVQGELRWAEAKLKSLD